MAAATTLFQGTMHVSYSQFYLDAGAHQPDFEDAFRGQRNGLCGAATAGFVWFTTGLHTGGVRLAAELLDGPASARDWDEVVEVSVEFGDVPVRLMGWGGADLQAMPVPAGSYRLRYSARGMDAGRKVDTTLGPAPDRYLVQLWPSAWQADEILRQTSDIAAYWHRWVQGLPAAPPDRPPSPPQQPAGASVGPTPSRRPSTAPVPHVAAAGRVLMVQPAMARAGDVVTVGVSDEPGAVGGVVSFLQERAADGTWRTTHALFSPTSPGERPTARRVGADEHLAVAGKALRDPVLVAVPAVAAGEYRIIRAYDLPELGIQFVATGTLIVHRGHGPG